jgi:hypothetical protein
MKGAGRDLAEGVIFRYAALLPTGALAHSRAWALLAGNPADSNPYPHRSQIMIRPYHPVHLSARLGRC